MGDIAWNVWWMFITVLVAVIPLYIATEVGIRIWRWYRAHYRRGGK